MTRNVQWNLTVDAATDALIRSHLATTPALSIDTFVVRAVERELDRISLVEKQQRAVHAAPSDDMWEIVIPRPRRRRIAGAGCSG